jgi:hypothetical protein
MKLAAGILAIAEAASVGGQVPSNAVCRDPDTGVVYQPNEEWVRNKIFNDGPTKGMQGQFSCVCQVDGSMRCSSLSLPCIINDRGYEIGEKFKLYNYMDKHMDYECECLGTHKGSVDCKEINSGCWDAHTQNKSPLNSEFEQTRKDDNLIRDCKCSGDEKTRFISCELSRYCILNGEYYEKGEEIVIETATQKQTCQCIDAARTSCIIEAKPIQDAVATQEIEVNYD